jgi:4-amino-4-deoxy-L-arabinose transferase-like glycosyltransferase
MTKKPQQRFDWILIGIALLSTFLNVFNIWNDKYANAYYTAAVTSMLQSFHNFFYASFDPGGFVTVDKPPVVFWIQTIFAYVFGVHSWSVILPQALAGVGSVLLMYSLIKPAFGATAARFASLIMACTPIAAAVSRTNNIDSMLVFTLLLATWMLFKATRTQKLSWLLAAFAMIGVGFNMKMLEAYMIAPAFYLFYLLAFKCKWRKKLAILALASMIMAGISVSWAVIVDSVPQQNRPYIGSSQTNSVLELAFGYNGISRLTGMNKGMGPSETPNQQQINQNANNSRSGISPNENGKQRQIPGNSMGGPGKQGSGAFGTGQPGFFRLFQTELSGQISWLIPFAAFASIGLLSGISRRKSFTAQQQETLFWLAWLLPAMVFFSVAGFFHHYYLIMLAPSIAALAGAGWVQMWEQYRNNESWKRWLLPSSILITTAFELYVLAPYQQQIGLGWSIGIGVSGVGISLALFFLAKKDKWSEMYAMVGILVLLVGPLYWAATPILDGDNSMLPQAGPRQQAFGPGAGGMPPVATNTKNSNAQEFRRKQGMGGGPNESINKKLLDYLIKHNTGETYLFATTNAGAAEPYIIETGKAVMAMGGFSGSDPILSVGKLKELVKNKAVKYFLISSGPGFGGPGGGGSSQVLDWIRTHCMQVPVSEWQSNASQRNPGGSMDRGGAEVLYKIKD